MSHFSCKFDLRFANGEQYKVVNTATGAVNFIPNLPKDFVINRVSMGACVDPTAPNQPAQVPEDWSFWFHLIDKSGNLVAGDSDGTATFSGTGYDYKGEDMIPALDFFLTKQMPWFEFKKGSSRCSGIRLFQSCASLYAPNGIGVNADIQYRMTVEYSYLKQGVLRP